MKTKIIYLRYKKKISTFREHFKKFFSLAIFKPEYVSVFSQLTFDGKVTKYTLDVKFKCKVTNKLKMFINLKLVKKKLIKRNKIKLKKKIKRVENQLF